MNERATDLSLAAILATLPLLPTGAQYLGLSTVSWAEGVLVLLIGLLLITRNARVGTGPAAMSLTAVGSVVALFIAAVTGGALIGLAHDNLVMSSAFLANLREAPMRLFAPMDQFVDPLYALRVWLTYLEGPVAFLLVVIICRRASDPRRRGRWALGGAVAGLAVVSAFALFQYIARFHLHPHWANSDLVRSHSTFEDPNALGSYLVFGIGLAVAVVLRERVVRPQRWRQWLAAGAGLLAVAALGATVSRAAWGAFTIAVLVLTAYAPPWDSIEAQNGWARAIQRSAHAGIAAIGVLYLVWLGARVWLPGQVEYHPTTPVEAVLQTVDPRVPLAEVIKGRHLFWRAAVDMALEAPVAGVGLGRYPRLVDHYLRSRQPRDNAHNFFLQLLAEIGAVGLLTFLLLVALAAWALRQAVRAGGSDAGLAWGLSLGCLAFVITLLTGHALLLPSVQLVIGTSLAAGLTATFTPSHDPKPRRSWRPIIAAATAAVTVVYGVAVSQSRWAGAADPYGYTWGLRGLDRDEAKSPFRRTGREALLYVATGGATWLTLQFAAVPPPAGAATTVTFSAAGQRASVVCKDGSWQQVTMRIDRAAPPQHAIQIRLDVDRAVVPGASPDLPELGVMLRPPKF